MGKVAVSTIKNDQIIANEKVRVLWYPVAFTEEIEKI
jgi:hypothetical protein